MSMNGTHRNSNQRITLDELYLAYRKAKIDLYYSSYRRIEDLSKWEKNLEANLQKLQEKINCPDLDDYLELPEFVGGVTYHPKNLDSCPTCPESTGDSSQMQDDETDDSNLIIFGDEGEGKELTQDCRQLSFRLLERCSVGFHVLSALWVAKVGEKLEKQRSNSLYSNYVRRSRDNEYNAAALGTYVPYIHGYRRWRDGAVKAAEKLLREETENAVVFQADISNFYYRIDPLFLNSPEVHEIINSLDLDPVAERVHECFKKSLIAWSYDNFEKLEKQIHLGTGTEAKHIGLPGGLSASPILSNLVLAKFDKEVDAQLNPTFYGRYVDDIVIVLRQSEAMKSVGAIRRWITDRVENFTYVSEEKGGGYFRLLPSLLKSTSNRELRFENRKNRILLLNGTSGAMSLELLKQQMEQTSSEWRLMPTLPSQPEELIGEIGTTASGTNKLIPHFGLLEETVVHKNNLSRVFRDLEFYSRNSDASSWYAYRAELYRIAKNSFLRWDCIADHTIYIPRIIRLAVMCKDYEAAIRLLHFIREQIEYLEGCQVAVSGFSIDKSETAVIFREWKNSLFSEIKSLIDAISPLEIDVSQRLNLFDALTLFRKVKGQVRAGDRLPELTEADYANKFDFNFATLFLQDLALYPFRESLAPMRTARTDLLGLSRFFKRVFDNEDIHINRAIVSWNGPEFNSLSRFVSGIKSFITALKEDGQDLVREMYPDHPEFFGALMFPTRALYSSQIMSWTSQFASKATSAELEPLNFDRLVEWVSVLRGYNLAGFVEKSRGRFKFTEDKIYVCNPRIDVKKDPIKIAVASLETKNGDWERAAWGQHRMDRTRLEQFTRLVNDILRVEYNIPKYVLLPELSIPPSWFEELSYNLAKRGINLIGGVEYQQASPKKVRNQVWASLIDYSFGFPISSIYRQDKQSPAVGEARKLTALGGLSLSPEIPFSNISGFRSPPIIQHGNFRFSILVCSELTNIQYKSSLRGKIDCLFVVEWNRDINTFNDLVNAAGWDIHSYVVQSNNRQYGDSRIRAPYKDQHRRDIVRIRGGLHDHFVVGAIDVKGLRAFQTKASSLNAVFKPTPDGFGEDMDRDRSVIPESN